MDYIKDLLLQHCSHFKLAYWVCLTIQGPVSNKASKSTSWGLFVFTFLKWLAPLFHSGLSCLLEKKKSKLRSETSSMLRIIQNSLEHLLRDLEHDILSELYLYHLLAKSLYQREAMNVKWNNICHFIGKELLAVHYFIPREFFKKYS